MRPDGRSCGRFPGIRVPGNFFSPPSQAAFVFVCYAHMKYLLALVLAAVFLIAGAWYHATKTKAPEPASADQEAEQAAAGGAIAPAIAWEFMDAGEVDGIPQTRVKVFIDGETHELGVSQGSCAELTAENLEENQVSGALCWYAGAGDEYGVFIENERYVVKKGVQEEPTAESAGFRGDFEVLLSL